MPKQGAVRTSDLVWKSDRACLGPQLGGCQIKGGTLGAYPPPSLITLTLRLSTNDRMERETPPAPEATTILELDPLTLGHILSNSGAWTAGSDAGSISISGYLTGPYPATIQLAQLPRTCFFLGLWPQIIDWSRFYVLSTMTDVGLASNRRT